MFLSWVEVRRRRARGGERTRLGRISRIAPVYIDKELSVGATSVRISAREHSTSS